MKTSTSRIPTENGAKYLVQLCKHFGHRLETRLGEGEGEGEIRFLEARARLQAEPGVFEITLEAETAEIVERIQGVVERHLDRFAFREAPLSYDWSPIV